MAGVSQVFSLADDVARYVKACGKRSVLECKPLQEKIDIKGLRLATDNIGDTINISSKKIIFKNGSLGGVGEKHLIAINPQGDELGNMVYSIAKKSKTTCYFPKEYLDSSGELLPHLHIDSLSSTGVVKGAGTAMMQEAVRESIRLGYGGRIVLDAGGQNITRSPLPFYFKMGMRCCSQNNDKALRQLPIETVNKLHLTSMHFGGIGPQKMYLPIENIETLLAL